MTHQISIYWQEPERTANITKAHAIKAIHDFFAMVDIKIDKITVDKTSNTTKNTQTSIANSGNYNNDNRS